ncbi:hypothetical protein BH10PSE19_BH10PSE19_17650 [soil metagenome]
MFNMSDFPIVVALRANVEEIYAAYEDTSKRLTVAAAAAAKSLPVLQRVAFVKAQNDALYEQCMRLIVEATAVVESSGVPDSTSMPPSTSLPIEATAKRQRDEAKDESTEAGDSKRGKRDFEAKQAEAKRIYDIYNGDKESDDAPDYNCTISQGFMVEPIQAPCEDRFEKKEIENWLATNHTCPNCRQDLTVEALKKPERFFMNKYNEYKQGLEKRYAAIQAELHTDGIVIADLQRASRPSDPASSAPPSNESEGKDEKLDIYGDPDLDPEALEEARAAQARLDALAGGGGGGRVRAGRGRARARRGEEEEKKGEAATEGEDTRDFRRSGWWETANHSSIAYFLETQKNTTSTAGYSCTRMAPLTLVGMRYLCAMIAIAKGRENRLANLPPPQDMEETVSVLELVVYNADIGRPGSRVADHIGRLFGADWDINLIIRKNAKWRRGVNQGRADSDFNVLTCVLRLLPGNTTSIKRGSNRIWDSLLAAGLDLAQRVRYAGRIYTGRELINLPSLPHSPGRSWVSEAAQAAVQRYDAAAQDDAEVPAEPLPPPIPPRAEELKREGEVDAAPVLDFSAQLLPIPPRLPFLGMSRLFAPLSPPPPLDTDANPLRFSFPPRPYIQARWSGGASPFPGGGGGGGGTGGGGDRADFAPFANVFDYDPAELKRQYDAMQNFQIQRQREQKRFEPRVEDGSGDTTSRVTSRPRPAIHPFYLQGRPSALSSSSATTADSSENSNGGGGSSLSSSGRGLASAHLFGGSQQPLSPAPDTPRVKLESVSSPGASTPQSPAPQIKPEPDDDLPPSALSSMSNNSRT